jgi:hypothetical protein
MPGNAVVELTPQGEVVIALLQELWVWRPGQRDLLRWQTGVPAGIRPVSVRVSEDGSEVAVGLPDRRGWPMPP